MPFISVHVNNSTVQADGALRIQTGISALMRDVMHKKYELTAVRVASQASDAWTTGGTPTSAQEQAVIQVDIHITKNTNTEDEKETMIGETWTLLDGILGPLNPIGYIIIHEHLATSWGYGGRSQADRKKTA